MCSPVVEKFHRVPSVLRHAAAKALLLCIAVLVLTLAACSGSGSNGAQTETRKRCPRSDYKVPCDYGSDNTLYRIR